MSSSPLVMQVCPPPPRRPRRDPHMVWFLAGSLAVHLGCWAVLEATPPEDPSFDAEQGWDAYPESFVGDPEPPVDTRESFVDYIPRELPKPSLDLEHCDVRSDDWASCVLGVSSFDVALGPLAYSGWGNCLFGASIPPSDYLRRPRPLDLSSLYGLDGPCGVAPSGDDPRCGFPRAGLDPKLGLEIRGPHYQFAHHERSSRSPVVRMAHAGVMSTASYDRSIVRRYLRRHLGEIGACYEAQLLAHPDRAGDVAVTFFITPTGQVPSSLGEGFDAGVAGCVANVVKTITFPRPRDGEGVQVNYSFHFQSPYE